MYMLVKQFQAFMYRYAEEIWVTHGREDALVYFCETQGLRGRALALIGREGEGE